MLADLGEQHHSDAAVCWGKVLHSSINPGKDVFFSTCVLNVKVCIFASPEIKVKSYNCWKRCNLPSQLAILNRNPIFRYLQIQSILPIRWSPFSSPDAVDSTGGAGDNMVDCQLFPKKYSCNHSSRDLKFQKKFHRHGCSVSLQDLKQNQDALPWWVRFKFNDLIFFKVNSLPFLWNDIDCQW